MVTPTYYVYFTSSTIVASAVLFQGFKGTAISITTVILGFLVICSGVVLLQLSKSSKDVPDTAVFKGDLDQIRTIAEVEEPEYEPRADTVRGGAAIVRALSKARTVRQVNEAHRIHDERMSTIGENETVQWDGLRRRTTVSETSGSIVRRKTVHPPLGMSQFPDEVSEPDSECILVSLEELAERTLYPAAILEVIYGVYQSLPQPADGTLDVDTSYHSPTAPSAKHLQWAGSVSDQRDRASSRGSSLMPPRPPPHGQNTTKRTFSFTNVFHRNTSNASNDRPTSRGGHSFASRNSDHQGETEEERLGLVHGDSSKRLPKYDEVPEAEEQGDDWQKPAMSPADGGDLGKQRRRDPYDDYDDDDDEDLHARPRTPGDIDGKGRDGFV
ncbi:hypothetical protein MRB53_037984 [Persea americana]|nr:hypothetical protein MRB53_037984 [Persea americana]